MQLNPATSPSPRAVSAMAYDPVSKKVVMFGGFNDTTYLNDTWTWDGTTWTQAKHAGSAFAAYFRDDGLRLCQPEIGALRRL